MDNVRRGYVYLVSLISLQSVAWAVISLLRDLLAPGRSTSLGSTAWQIALIVIGICVAAYFLFIRNGAGPEQGESSQDVADATEKVTETPIPVKVDKARIGELIISLKSPGEAVTKRMVTIKNMSTNNHVE